MATPVRARGWTLPHSVTWSSDDAPIPKIVNDVATRVTGSRIFSVDVAMRRDGQARVIELGDGQVSDIVGWTRARFASMWAGTIAAHSSL